MECAPDIVYTNDIVIRSLQCTPGDVYTSGIVIGSWQCAPDDVTAFLHCHMYMAICSGYCIFMLYVLSYRNLGSVLMALRLAADIVIIMFLVMCV